MVNHASIKTPSQTVNLTFGTYALKKFCNLMGCGTGVMDVVRTFQGTTFYNALVSAILAGAEHTALAQNKPFALTEFAVCEILDGVTEVDPKQGEKLMYALVGSIINKTADETQAFVEDVTKAINEAEQAETEDEEPNEKKSF